MFLKRDANHRMPAHPEGSRDMAMKIGSEYSSEDRGARFRAAGGGGGSAGLWSDAAFLNWRTPSSPPSQKWRSPTRPPRRLQRLYVSAAKRREAFPDGEPRKRVDQAERRRGDIDPRPSCAKSSTVSRKLRERICAVCGAALPHSEGRWTR
jgi:hypothetical protein